MKKDPSESLNLRVPEGGFSLVEISVVVTILGILTSLSISNISKWLKLSHIDEAMTVLNNSLVDCLQESRSGIDPNTISPSDNIIDNTRLKPAKYKIKDSNNTCSDFFITSKINEDKVRFEMGYQITVDGNATKLAKLPDEQAAQSRCYRWAGKNCGASPEQIQALQDARELAQVRKQCKADFSSWLNDTLPSGGIGLSPFNRWDENTDPPSCSIITYAFEGEIVANEQAVIDARERKLGKQCTAKIVSQRELKTNGIKTFQECNDQTFFFCDGRDRQSEDGMELCLAEKDLLSKRNEELQCEKDREAERLGGYAGYYAPKEGPDSCGNEYWMCEKKIYSEESAYNKSNCAGKEEEQGGQIKTAIDCLNCCTNPNHESYIRTNCNGFDARKPNKSICNDLYACMEENEI